MFVGATSGRMFGGDTILNEISPNVGLWGEGESKDPLAEFAHSLERIRDGFEPRIIYPGTAHRSRTPPAGSTSCSRITRSDSASA